MIALLLYNIDSKTKLNKQTTSPEFQSINLLKHKRKKHLTNNSASADPPVPFNCCVRWLKYRRTGSLHIFNISY